MKSNKLLSTKEFEVSQLLKRAMGCPDNLTEMRTYILSALRVLHSE